MNRLKFSSLLLVCLAACSDGGGTGADASLPDTDETGFPDSGVFFDATSPDLGFDDAGVPIDGGFSDSTMTFFVTSVGNGANGGNYGGLAGADGRCEQLASAVGLGHKTWRAYLSTATQGSAMVHAKDRIGTGPWFNHAGTQVAASVADLHATPITYTNMLTETGQPVPANEHDILTGTQANGEAWPNFPGNPAAPPPNCDNWTSNSSNSYTYVGHSNWDDPNTAGNPHWSASHDTTCDQAGLQSTAGSGRLYCFAID